MTRVAFVIEGMGGGGAQRVLALVSRYLVTEGIATTVVTFRPEEEDQLLLPNGVERVVLGKIERSSAPLSALTGNVRRILAIRRSLKKIDPDVVVGMVGTTNILTVLAAAGLKCRKIVSERNDPARQSLGNAWDFLRRWIYPRADIVTANSRHAIDTMKSFVDEKKLVFLQNPIAKCETESFAQRGSSVILAVGRLNEQKGYDILLDGFARLAHKFPGWRLVILGEGPLRNRLETQASMLGISDRVEWKGFCSDVCDYYKEADIYVMTSRFEGTPNALLEAMINELPVVVSNGIPAAVSLIQPDINGVFFRALDADDLAASLERLMLDRDLRIRLGEAASASLVPKSAEALNDWKHCILGVEVGGRS